MRHLILTLSLILGLAGCGATYDEMKARDQVAYDAFDEVMAKGTIISSSNAAFGSTKMVVKYNDKMYTCFLHTLSVDKSRCEAAK